jgi:NAD(P)H dehydrogenase (quinone)
MIIVTGATGKLGHAIVENLASRVPAGGVGASCRDPAKATDLVARGVRVRRGDFADPESLGEAFEGATQLLMVSSNVRAQGGDTLAQHRNAIAAARAAGVQRIVYTSHMAASPTSAFPPMRDHAATEELLRDSGIAWTALRHGFYASSGIAMLGGALESGRLETTADGLVTWTAHADLAEAAAVLLARGGLEDGPTPPLTGSQALDFGELATIASDLRGRPIARVVLTDEALREKMIANGAPAAAIDMVLGLYRAARNGEFSASDPTLERLLGRPPMTMRALMAETIGG